MKRIEGKGTYDSVKIGEGGVYLKKKKWHCIRPGSITRFVFWQISEPGY